MELMTPACNAPYVEVALWIYQSELGTLWSLILYIFTSGGFLCDNRSFTDGESSRHLGHERQNSEASSSVNLGRW